MQNILIIDYFASPEPKILTHSLLQQLGEGNLSVKLTDAPRNGDYIDTDNDFINDSCGSNKNIHIGSADGMYIRHKYMINEMLNMNGDISVQVVGTHHIDDIENPDLKNSETLISFADASGYDVIGHIIKDDLYQPSVEKYPNIEFSHQNKLHISPSISKEEYYYDCYPTIKQLIDDDTEIEWVNTKINILGMGDVIKDGVVNICIERHDDFHKHVENIRKLSIKSQINLDHGM